MYKQQSYEGTECVYMGCVGAGEGQGELYMCVHVCA